MTTQGDSTPSPVDDHPAAAADDKRDKTIGFLQERVASLEKTIELQKQLIESQKGLIATLQRTTPRDFVAEAVAREAELVARLKREREQRELAERNVAQQEEGI